MRLGSLDPHFLYHAGIVSLRAGQTERAERYLGLLVDRSPRFSPLQAPDARAALHRLRDGAAPGG